MNSIRLRALPFEVFKKPVVPNSTEAITDHSSSINGSLVITETLEVISDIHLSIRPEDSFNLNVERQRQLAPFLATLKDCPKGQIITVDLNGDILDLTRDWKSWKRPPVALKRKVQNRKAARLIQEEVTANSLFFQALVNFIREDPLHHHVNYNVGNHDRWINLKPGKKAFFEALALSPVEQKAFKIENGTLYHPAFKTLVLHGHQLDKSCKGPNNLGETVDIVMLNGLGKAILNRLTNSGVKLTEETTRNVHLFLENLYYIRPVSQWGEYLHGHFEGFLKQMQSAVAQAIYEELSYRLNRLTMLMNQVGTPRKKKFWKNLPEQLQLFSKKQLMKVSQQALDFMAARHELIDQKWKKNIPIEARWGRATQKFFFRALAQKIQQKVSEKQLIDQQVTLMRVYANKHAVKKHIAYVVGGHTHTPFAVEKADRTYINPGSSEREIIFNSKETLASQPIYPHGFMVMQKDVTGKVSYGLKNSVHSP